MEDMDLMRCSSLYLVGSQNRAKLLTLLGQPETGMFYFPPKSQVAGHFKRENDC